MVAGLMQGKYFLLQFPIALIQLPWKITVEEYANAEITVCSHPELCCCLS